MGYVVRAPSPETGRRVAVVLNANARHVTRRVVARARAVVPASDLYLSRDFASAQAIAAKLVARGYEAVLAGGGDGTFVRCVSDLHAAAAQQGRSAPAVGLLRLGTGNAMAEAIGVSRGRSLAELYDSARSAPARALELLTVDGQLTPFAGVGLDAQVLDDYNATTRMLDRMRLRFVRSGAIRYALAVILRSLPRFLFSRRIVVTAVNLGSPALRIGPDGRPVGQPIRAGELLYHGPVSIASGSTIPYYGLGLKLFPYAGTMPGRFHLRISDCPAHEILTHLPALFRGTMRSPRIHDFLCDRVALYADREAPLQIGGDIAGRRRMVTLALAPRPVSVVS
jgi:diacylglycerol kinase family enzyme